jgi:hypothetical protein
LSRGAETRPPKPLSEVTRSTRPKKRARSQLGEQDLRVLEMLGHHRAVDTRQVAEWLACTEGTARKRLRRLAGPTPEIRASPREGFVAIHLMQAGQSPTVTIADKGLAVLGRRPAAVEVKWSERRHDIGVAWLWLAAQQGAFGSLRNTITEREMVAHDSALDSRPEVERMLDPGKALGLGAGLLTESGRPHRHYPDLLLETTDGHQLAVELELSRKNSSRLDLVMEHYACDSRVDSVLYLVADEYTARKVEQAARKALIGDFVQIRLLESDLPASSGRGATAARRRPNRAASRAVAERGSRAER